MHTFVTDCPQMTEEIFGELIAKFINTLPHDTDRAEVQKAIENENDSLGIALRSIADSSRSPGAYELGFDSKQYLILLKFDTFLHSRPSSHGHSRY